MNQYQGILLIRCKTAMLPGSGEGHDFIDRAVQRNVLTGTPYLQGSSKKGSLLNVAREKIKDAQTRDALFGKEGKDGHQGCCPVTDAEVLLFPVASLRGGYAWAASVSGLAGFAETLRDTGADAKDSLAGKIEVLFRRARLRDEECLVPKVSGNPCPLGIKDGLDNSYHLALNGLVLKGIHDENLASITTILAHMVFSDDSAMMSFMKSRIVIVGEDAFKILINTGMQKEASIQILKTGVTKPKSLRYSEYIPAGAVLASTECVKRPRIAGTTQQEAWEALRTLFGTPTSPARHRFGADETTGKGIAHTLFLHSDTQDIYRDKEESEDEKVWA